MESALLQFVNNDYVTFEPSDVIIQIAKRGDVQMARLLAAFYGEKISRADRLKATNLALEHGHDECAGFFMDEWTTAMTAAPRKRARNTHLDLIDNAPDLVKAILHEKGLAPSSYKPATQHALDGLGIKMKGDNPSFFGINDCLKTKPLNLETGENVNLWLEQLNNHVENDNTTGPGALRAVLGHFKRVHAL